MIVYGNGLNSIHPPIVFSVMRIHNTFCNLDFLYMNVEPLKNNPLKEEIRSNESLKQKKYILWHLVGH